MIEASPALDDSILYENEMEEVERLTQRGTAYVESPFHRKA
jgi:hypothetical protein